MFSCDESHTISVNPSGILTCMGPSGTLCCSGEAKKGSPLLNGHGKSYDLETNALLYNGEWKHGLKHGHGTSYKMGKDSADCPVYDGEWQRGMQHGYGKLFDESGNVIYEGGWHYNLYDGLGCLYENGVLIHEGKFRRGKAHGEGKSHDYIGMFRYGFRWGFGKDANFSGMWIAGKPDVGILTEAVKKRRKRKLIIKNEAELEFLRSNGFKQKKQK